MTKNGDFRNNKEYVNKKSDKISSSMRIKMSWNFVNNLIFYQTRLDSFSSTFVYSATSTFSKKNCILLNQNCNDPKISDRQAQANNVDPYQTSPQGLFAIPPASFGYTTLW